MLGGCSDRQGEMKAMYYRGKNDFSCCKGCLPPKRRLRCHASCPEYEAFKEKRERERSEKTPEQDYEDYVSLKVHRRKAASRQIQKRQNER